MKQTNWGAAISAQCGVVPMIYGLPGVGKTAVFRQLAQQTGRRFLQCILRQMMPEDLGGVPVPSKIIIGDQTLDCVVKLLSEEIIRAQHEPSIVLLDEFNHAGHDVMGAAQEWINNPPPNCWMIAASNPVEASTNGVELAAPVINRMCRFDWERPVEDRQAGWRNGFRDYPVSRLPLVEPDYLDLYGKRWGELMAGWYDDTGEFHSGFEQKFPHLFGDEAFPKDPTKASEPWASDRSWTNVGKLLCGCDSVGANGETRAACVRGCVGDAASKEFLAWVAAQDLPDPYDLLEHPDTLNIRGQRFDIARATLMSVLGAVKALGTPEAWEQAADVIEVAKPQAEEVTAVCFAGLWKIQPTGYVPRVRNGVFAELRKLLLSTSGAA